MVAESLSWVGGLGGWMWRQIPGTGAGGGIGALDALSPLSWPRGPDLMPRSQAQDCQARRARRLLASRSETCRCRNLCPASKQGRPLARPRLTACLIWPSCGSSARASSREYERVLDAASCAPISAQRLVTASDRKSSRLTAPPLTHSRSPSNRLCLKLHLGACATGWLDGLHWLMAVLNASAED